MLIRDRIYLIGKEEIDRLKKAIKKESCQE